MGLTHRDMGLRHRDMGLTHRDMGLRHRDMGTETQGHGTDTQGHGDWYTGTWDWDTGTWGLRLGHGDWYTGTCRLRHRDMGLRHRDMGTDTQGHGDWDWDMGLTLGHRDTDRCADRGTFLLVITATRLLFVSAVLSDRWPRTMRRGQTLEKMSSSVIPRPPGQLRGACRPISTRKRNVMPAVRNQKMTRMREPLMTQAIFHVHRQPQ